MGLFFPLVKGDLNFFFLGIAQTSPPQYLLCIICSLKIEISVNLDEYHERFHIQAF